MAWYYHRTDELYHHGILGQKWGIRRYQNKDGSLTPAGKKRYSITDVSNEFSNSLNQNKDAVARIKEVGPKIGNMADELGKKYEREFNNVKLSDESKQYILKSLEYDLGSGTDDPELFDLLVNEYVGDEVNRVVYKKLSTDMQNFYSMQDKYWDDVKSVTSGIIEKYSNADIVDTDYKTKFGAQVVNDLIDKELDTRWNSYVYRHFEDYWVMDTEAHTSAIDRVAKELGLSNAEEYNRTHAQNGK